MHAKVMAHVPSQKDVPKQLIKFKLAWSAAIDNFAKQSEKRKNGSETEIDETPMPEEDQLESKRISPISTISFLLLVQWAAPACWANWLATV